MPDPIDSGLSTQFDDYVDTIERAAAADHYVDDRFYDPWPPSPLNEKSSSDGSKEQGNASDTAQSGNQIRLYEREPGLISFSK